jgi:hypothetical protein
VTSYFSKILLKKMAASNVSLTSVNVCVYIYMYILYIVRSINMSIKVSFVDLLTDLVCHVFY